MTAPPRLASIVINNYNYVRYLHCAIDSALAQTWPDREVIVVDDGSTDGSREVIASYGDRVRAVLKPNGGQASAFNAGFAASRGDVVFFLDADDSLFPTAVERVLANWREGAAKAHYHLQVIDADGAVTGKYVVPGPRVDGAEPPLARGDVWPTIVAMGYYPTVPTSGNAFSREHLSRVFPMPEEEYRISADDYLFLFAGALGSVVAVDETLGSYRVHGANRFFRADESAMVRAALGTASRTLERLQDHVLATRPAPRARDVLRVQKLLCWFARSYPGAVHRTAARQALRGLGLALGVPVSPGVRAHYLLSFSLLLGFAWLPERWWWWRYLGDTALGRWYHRQD